MLSYDWPGNVRELENCLEAHYAFTTGPLIHTNDLPPEIADLPRQDRPLPTAMETASTRRSFRSLSLKRKPSCRTITELNGDKLQAARLLGIGKTTLYRKLKDYAAQEVFDAKARF